MLAPRAAVSADRIKEVLDAESSVVATGDPVDPARRASVARAPRRRVRVPGCRRSPCSPTSRSRPGAGETTAIIGSTGAGKTTLLNLVPRLFDATGGSVLVDGFDVRDIEPELLWSRIGLVPQKPYLFSGTVASNLRYANPDATDEELWEALEIAQARDFVAAMPRAARCADRQGGTNVSGGQRQRLAIARALVRRPGHLPLRRLVLGARPRDRRPPAGRARPGRGGRGDRDRRPARLHDHQCRPDPRHRGRPPGRARHAPRAARANVPPTPRSSRRSSPRRRRRERGRPTSAEPEEAAAQPPEDARARGMTGAVGRRGHAARTLEGLQELHPPARRPAPARAARRGHRRADPGGRERHAAS